MANSDRSFFDRHHFLLRRLHSLTGVLPLGVFLLFHLFTNSLLFYEPEKFNEEVHWIHSIPYLWFLEYFGILIPLAYHALYGVAVAMTGKSNALQYAYADNVRYTLQRLSGWIALAFILIHLLHFRFAHWLGGPHYYGTSNPFGLTQESFASAGGIPGAVWFPIYIIGVIAVVYHFANGIVTFCITWGITVGDRSRKYMSVAAGALGLVLLYFGLSALVGLRSKTSPAPDTASDHAVVQVEKPDGPEVARSPETTPTPER